MSSIPANRRVLVIDDNRAIHEDFRKVLTDSGSSSGLDAAEEALFGDTAASRPVRATFNLDYASQGLEGVEKIQQAREAGVPFAMAFVDVRMPPGIDGIETTVKIWEVAPDTQIVICTAYSDYSWDEMVGKVGYSDKLVLLKKPFDNVEVLQLACALTEKWRLAQEAKLKMDQLERMVIARTAELRNSVELLQQSVTNYKRTEQRLRRSEERFRLITENAADLIIVVDGAGRPQYLSPSVVHTLGYAAEELLRGSLFSLVHPEDRAATVDILKSALRQSTDQVLEYRLQHKQGYWRKFEAHASIVRESDSNAGNLVLVSRDITERDRAEKENFRLAIQLQRAGESGNLGAMAAAIASELGPLLEAVRDKVRFAEGAARQLQPLLRAEKELLTAAVAQKLTPELLATATAADRATDVDYLAGEVPKALTEAHASIERIADILADIQADAPA
ncbi:MAG: PAS domain S-box protein [Verrucomicrobia bacterium]|nr:PAS domain S-box protein [Verrucomicrobiota bacterium]